MASPKEVFESLKKSGSAMNPFGGNATPPKKAGKPDMGKIRAKGKEIAKGDEPEAVDNPKEEKAEGKKGFPFKKGK